MDSTIIVALIVAGGSIATQLIIAAVSKKSTTALIEYRIDQLEEKVMRHNNLIERMYNVEAKVSELEKKGE